ncbi:MAG: erythromycin esterase family protein [Candidatus Aminicenantes bacterium]|nr:MAG: erythromycin esterase family protein [Candidatus Aminicenantes bacterium]
MKKKIKFNLIILLCITMVFFACYVKKETTPEPNLWDLVDELNQVIIPINGSAPNLDTGDLKCLDFLGDVKIVGLGEATHGTKEFFQMKHRIFKYLVEEHGFKAFGFECDFAESLYFDKYITTGQGDLEELMKKKMNYWVWRTEEVKALLEWMRNYNNGKAGEDMIHYYGIECFCFPYYADFLTEYLQGVSRELLDASASLLTKIKNLDRIEDEYENMSKEEFEQFQEDLQWLYDRWVENEDEFVSISGRREYEISKHLVRGVAQANHQYYENYQGRTRFNWRDQYMAENALWLLDLLGENEKIALWAHNRHVANHYCTDFIWSVGGYMGYYLKQELAENYQIIGFSFSTGAFNAWGRNPRGGKQSGLYRFYIDSVPMRDSINFLFYHAQHDNFMLNFSTLSPNSQLRDWLTGPKLFLYIGAGYSNNPKDYYYITPLLEHYDVLINFDHTSEAGIIKTG